MILLAGLLNADRMEPQLVALGKQGLRPDLVPPTAAMIAMPNHKIAGYED